MKQKQRAKLIRLLMNKLLRADRSVAHALSAGPEYVELLARRISERDAIKDEFVTLFEESQKEKVND